MKKLLLSFIGLIGILEKCAFVSGTVAALDDTCNLSAVSECSSEVTSVSNTYCFETNILYEKITDSESNDCKTVKITLEAGIHVFKVNSASDVTKLSLTETIEDTDVGKLAMYSCTGTGQSVTCSKADGYVKIGNDYFTISTNSDVESAKISGSGYYLLSAGATSTTDLILCNTGNCNTATKSNGFFVNDKDVYECTASSCNKQTPNEVTSCTGDANKVIKDTGDSNKLKYCANTDSTALELSSSTVEGYITKSGDNITILKTIPFAVTTVASATGYFIVDTDKLTSCSTTSNVVTCTEPSNTVLGYYKVTDTTYKTSVEYIKCDGSACAKETPGNTAGIANLITGDDNKVKLHITNTADDPLPEFKATTTKYMISIATANAFSSTDVANNFVLISITDTAITVSESSGYYIASATTNELISVKDTEGTLYSCASNKCTATTTITAADIGYYKNADTTALYIKCYEDSTTNPVSYKCGTIEAPANTVTCGSSTIGQLVKNGKFCLNGSKEATFETTTGNTKMYQLSYSADSIFASTVTEEGIYGIVKVGTDSIKLISAALTNKVCVSTSDLVVTDSSAADCGTGTEECKKLGSTTTCYYDCVNSTGKNCLEGRYYLFDKTSTDTLVTSGEGTLVKCKASGACDSVTDVVGYFVNSDFGTASTNSHIKCAVDTDEIKCELYSPTAACSSSIAGQLSTDAESFCFGGSTPIQKGFATTEDDENARYLLGYDASSPFSSVIPNGKSGIIKIGKYDVTLDTDYQSDYGVCTNDSTLAVTERTSATDCASGSTKTGFCSGGICFNPCQVSATTRDTTTCLNDNYYLVKDAASSIPIMDETTSGSLYLCEGNSGACTAVTTVGYYLNSKDEAFICETANNALGCKRMSLPTGCLAATIGQPIIDTDTKAYFCLDYATSATKSGIMADASSVSKNHLLGYKEGNIFGITENHYGLISVTKSSVTLVNKSGYCLGDKTALTSLAEADDEGKLYNCVNGICEAVPDTDTTMAVGYYKNIGSLAPGDVDYIEFTTATSGSTITKTFKALSITGAANAACAAASIGKIILDSGTSKYTMCLTDSIGIELGVEANNGQYFVDVTKATVFGAKTTADTHAIIDISGDNVTLHAKETGVERYRYGSATTQKLIDFTATADTTTYCAAGSDITTTTIEFSLIDEEEGDTTNYYKKLAYPSP